MYLVHQISNWFGKLDQCIVDMKILIQDLIHEQHILAHFNVLQFLLLASLICVFVNLGRCVVDHSVRLFVINEEIR